MTTWHEQGTHTPKPTDKLTAIEQDGFGIVCAVLDYEGESVYRILRAVNAYDELLSLCDSALRALHEDDFPMLREELRAAIAKAELTE